MTSLKWRVGRVVVGAPGRNHRPVPDPSNDVPERRPPRTPRRWLRGALPVAVVLGVVAFGARRHLSVYAQRLDGQSCVGCHATENPRIIDQWVGSAHFTAGVGCAGCHGVDHDAMFAADGDVSPRVCAECHADEVTEFSRGAHARAERDARQADLFKAAPPEIQRQGCMLCHSIGKIFPDGSSGRCNHCHTGHRFSAAEARAPHACEGCHMGPDHPQIEAWNASKHGISFRALGDENTAPTCVGCHLGGEAGHDESANMTLGRGAAGAVLEGEPQAVPMKTLTQAEFTERRERMLALCRPCHGAKFARQALEDADLVKRAADALVAEAADILRSLAAEGVLAPMPEDRPAHPTAGHALVLGGAGLYTHTSAVEQRFFEMARFHHSITFKGAYHFSPDHTHWTGYAAMQGDLNFIRDEARRLRLEAARRPAAPASGKAAP